MNIPQVHKLSRASQLSLVAIVILLGAVFFTVNSALQQQNEAGHASTTTYGTISVRSRTYQNNGGGSLLKLNTPPSVVAGDVLIAEVVVHLSNIAITTPSGWTLIRKDSTPANLEVALYYKVASGADPSSFDWDYTSSEYASGGILDMANVSTSNPIDADSSQMNYLTNPMIAPSVTTTTPADMLLFFGGVVDSASPTPPSGMSTMWSLSTSLTTAYAADKLLTTSGATGTKTGTSNLSTSSNIADLVALRPTSNTIASTPVPTVKPTTVVPTAAPTARPTAVPTAVPTAIPTAKPTTAPTPVSSNIIGNTSIGTIQDTGDTNCLNGLKVTAPAAGGTITSASIYVTSVVVSPNNEYKIGIYSDNGGHPNNLLAQSSVGTLGSGWNTIPVSLTLSPNTSYWLMYYTNGNNNGKYNTQTSPMIGAYICPGSFGAFPSNISGATLVTAVYSLYATLGNSTPTVNPTPIPTRVPTPIPTATPSPTPSPIPTQIPQPTETPVPGDTTLSFTVGLHGIGTGGDSANPNSLGNTSPLRPTRTITADIYDAQNQLVVSQQGDVTYDTASGKFIGNVDLGNNFATGLYTIKVKTDQYLRALVPGIQTIAAGQTVTMPTVTLVAGDINGDNQINIVDYNLLIGCYSDLLPATDCTPENKVLTDLNDDGSVNAFDYNLFLRELTNIGGQ